MQTKILKHKIELHNFDDVIVFRLYDKLGYMYIYIRYNKENKKFSHWKSMTRNFNGEFTWKTRKDN